MPRPTKIEIDLSALERNLKVVRSYAQTQKIACCVKANAYGHDMVQVAKQLSKSVDALAVASIEEAIELRRSSISVPILLLEGVFSPSELGLVAELDLWIVIHNQRQLDWLLATENPKLKTDVWLKIDTGMHRLGFMPEQIASVLNQLEHNSSVSNTRLMTHFACADELDNKFTDQQTSSFFDIANKTTLESSLSNSAAIITHPNTHADWVRPGFMLYGLSPFGQNHPSASQLEPVMSFTTEIIDIKTIQQGEGVGYNHSWRAEKDTDIAVLAVGYGDGYPRNTKNGAPVWVNGHIAKTIGHIAMDMMMVDISHIEAVKVGGAVELWGKNLSANEVATYSGYSPYELLTRMPQRVTRQFLS